MAAPPGRHCPKAPHRALRRLPLHRRAVGWRRCVSTTAGPSVTCKLARHMTVALFPSLFTIDTSGRAPACCGGVLEVRGVHKLSRHTPQTRFFTFVLAFFSHEGCFFSILLFPECDRMCTSIAIPNHMHRLVVIASSPALCSTMRNVQYPFPEIFF